MPAKPEGQAVRLADRAKLADPRHGKRRAVRVEHGRLERRQVVARGPPRRTEPPTSARGRRRAARGRSPPSRWPRSARPGPRTGSSARGRGAACPWKRPEATDPVGRRLDHRRRAPEARVVDRRGSGGRRRGRANDGQLLQRLVDAMRLPVALGPGLLEQRPSAGTSRAATSHAAMSAAAVAKRSRGHAPPCSSCTSSSHSATPSSPSSLPRSAGAAMPAPGCRRCPACRPSARAGRRRGPCHGALDDRRPRNPRTGRRAAGHRATGHALD